MYGDGDNDYRAAAKRVQSAWTDRGPVLLAALLSSLMTAGLMLVAVPNLAYPELSRLVRSDVARLEKDIQALKTEAERQGGVRYLYSLSPGLSGSLSSTVAGAGADVRGAKDTPPLTAVTVAAERVAPAVVGIFNRQQTDGKHRGPHSFDTSGSGSGVIIDPAGYIVTNQHVVEDAESLVVVLADGRRLAAKLVGADKRNDLAVVKIEAKNLPVAVFGDSDKIRIGDLAVAIGNPVSMEFQRTVTAGIISGLNRGLRTERNGMLEVIQTDAAISPGNSGGPLVNALGQVIGINTAKISLPDVEGMGFAVPSNRVRSIVKQIIEAGRVEHPWLGVAIADPDPMELGEKPVSGVLIADVVPGGPAQLAGVQKGDQILSVDGKSTDSYLALRRAIEAHRVGDTVAVKVRRGEKEITLRVTLGVMPDVDQQ